MKHVALKLLLLLMVMVVSSNAAVYTFRPNPSDLNDLDHYRYVTWGINWNHRSERIVEATLTFTDIWNWRHERNNLYTHLLDNPRSGTNYYWDNQGGGDNFSGQGYLVGNWSDPVGGHSRNYNLTYRFSELGLLGALNTYASDGRFGFGFDPDCHYFNRGVCLTITTADKPTTTPVPEPASMLLFGLGMAGVGIVRRFKK
jgi:hypothetical protein